ncbi:hypothetical protein Q0M94_12855 [Deinococcus radiomollis]|uniref:hypothetical protein n=1 Tax=Deinococcus radiomollis TaxID=468916 RepID=UPI00389242E5
MSRGLKCGLGVGVLAFSLVACGHGEGLPDSSAQVTGVKSEFRTQGGAYVVCSAVIRPDGTLSTRTALAVYFTATEAVKTATVALRGQPTSQYDAFYVQTAAPSQLSVRPGNPYRLLLSAASTSAVYLAQPSHIQTLAVRPPGQVVKVNVVRATNRQDFSFSPQVTVNGAGMTGSDRSALALPVYGACTVLSTDASDTL